MTIQNYVLRICAMLVIATLLIAGCAAPTPSPTPPEVPTPTEVLARTEVPTETPTAVPAVEEPKVGGYATLVYGEDPDTLNLALSGAWITGQVAWAIVEGLVDVGPDGFYRPLVAAELPSKQNGTVSEDGLTITWKLRKGLKWNDGQPVTSEDIRFTWKAVMASGIDKAGFDQIESIETPDDLTVIVHYSSFYTDYLGQFKYLFPAHAGDPNDMPNWEYNRNPIGTGPFMLKEWAVDDHITLVRNPYYWKEGKPYLDGVIYRIVPDYEAHLLMLAEGDVDHLWISPSQIPQVREMENVDLYEGDIGWMARLWFNLADPSADGEPEPPHPILGDPKVRLAIKKAFDWDQIIYGIYNGLGAIRATTPFYKGWYKVDIPAEPIDVEAAKALLEEAGWKDEDGDGIRECHGCLYASEGTVMSLRLEGYKYTAEWDQAHIVAQDMLKDIGIDVKLQLDEMSYMFGTFADGAPRATGDFDMLLYDTTSGIDPQEHFYATFHSSQIPTKANQGQGRNWCRYVNKDVDKWLEEAGLTPDIEKRKELYTKIAKQLDEDNPVLCGVIFTDNLAYSKRLNGWVPNLYWPETADMEDWWISE
ncbi:MAG TPA: peptide ABC transporter substrate-binding protein [Anaerolineales bacterium]|nr:peptide ABC transporter substrate-binding protein [Anaerolineales bacterium]